MFKAFLIGTVIGLCLIININSIYAQCGLPGTPACEPPPGKSVNRTVPNGRLGSKTKTQSKNAGNSSKSKKKSTVKRAVSRVPLDDRDVVYNASENCGSFRNCLNAYTKIIEQNPNNLYAYEFRGDSYFYNKNYSEAAKDFSKIIELTSNNLKQNGSNLDEFRRYQSFQYTYLKRAKSYQELGNYEEADKDYDKLISLRSDAEGRKIFFTTPVLSVRGNIYFKQGKYDEAIKDFTRSVETELSPNYHIGNQFNDYIQLGLAYLKKEDYEQATKAFTKAIAILPNLSEGYNNRAYVYQKLGNYDLAIKDYSESINKALKYPENPSAQIAPFTVANTYKYRGDVHQLKGDSESAKKDYEDAVKNYTKSIAKINELRAIAGYRTDETDLLKDNYKNRAIVYRLLAKADLAEADERMYEKIR